MKPVSLDIFNQQQPTIEQLEEALNRAQRAEALLINEDFMWWLDMLEAHQDRRRKKITSMNIESSHERYLELRGMIRSIEEELRLLRMRAESADELRRKVDERRTNPVARGA